MTTMAVRTPDKMRFERGAGVGWLVTVFPYQDTDVDDPFSIKGHDGMKAAPQLCGVYSALELSSTSTRA